MASGWPSTVLADKDHALKVLTDLRGKRWISRGQSEPWDRLQPSIDRKREKLSRLEMLMRERQSIDLYRSAARFFAGNGERHSLRNDVVALMVMRHYGVPTRLLDWTQSPSVSAYFASGDEAKQGEIWTFDYDRYLEEGPKQWQKWKETTSDRSGNQDKFDANLTAFTVADPPDWFICAFYDPGDFPRQDAQLGLYSMTAQFHRDHNDSITSLLVDQNFYHRYLVPPAVKADLRKALREHYGTWRGSLFPDTAGAAETAKCIFPE